MYLENSQIFLFLIFACGLVFIIVILFLYSKAQQYQLYYNLQQSSERERIKQIERERNLVAVELHDNICMQLLTVGMDLDSIEPDRMEHHSLLSKTKKHVSGIINDLRRMSYDLLPVGVGLKGPLYAFEDFVLNRLGNTTMEIEVTPADCRGLSESQSLHLYRMLQEMLQNALKHSKADQFVVQADRDGDKLVIQVWDNGIGFEPESRKNGTGVGLYNLATRAEMIGATLITRSAQGKGTRYEIRLDILNNRT